MSTKETTDIDMRATYVRLYCDGAGTSHFEEVTVPLDPTEFAPPAPPLHVSKAREAERFVFVGGPTGWDGDWHPAPTRQFVFCLSGTFEVTASDGECRVFGPGDVLLLEDTEGRGHKTLITENGLTAMVQLD